MKILTAALVLIFSQLALSNARIEFRTKFEGQECVISGNKVTRTVTMRDGKLGFSVSKEFSGFGYEEMAKKAASLSTNREQNLIKATVKIDGSTYTLSHEDSDEASALIYFIGSACK